MLVLMQYCCSCYSITAEYSGMNVTNGAVWFAIALVFIAAVIAMVSTAARVMVDQACGMGRRLPRR